MGSKVPAVKPIVASLLLAVGTTAPALPAWAQDVLPPPDALPDALDQSPESAGESPRVAPRRPGATDAEREADLLAQLRDAETPYAAGLVTAELNALWSRSGSPTIDLLMKRGQDALEAGDAQAAIEHFTAAADHAPAFAGAYAGRASAYYLTGRVGPAIDDLREALLLNPSDLDSLKGFAAILEELERPEDALEVWTRVADMNPQDEEAAQSVARLDASTQGQAL